VDFSIGQAARIFLIVQRQIMLVRSIKTINLFVFFTYLGQVVLFFNCPNRSTTAI
jgi:hypothetical protein